MPVEWREEEARAEVPPQHASARELLRRALEQIGPAYGEVTPAYEDASWVSMRLAEILPLAAIERQELLELNERDGAAALDAVAAEHSGIARRIRRQLRLIQLRVRDDDDGEPTIAAQPITPSYVPTILASCAPLSTTVVSRRMKIMHTPAACRRCKLRSRRSQAHERQQNPERNQREERIDECSGCA